MDVAGISAEDTEVLAQEYKKYCKEHKLRCSTHCSLYNSIDRNCDFLGNHHPSISKCGVGFVEWCRRKEK